MDKLTQTAPPRIFLQVSDEANDKVLPWPEDAVSSGDVTWCDKPALQCEVEYTRSDIAGSGGPPLPESPTEDMLANACMWESHDFGLCSADERRRRMAVMQSNWHAIYKALTRPGDGANHLPEPKP